MAMYPLREANEPLASPRRASDHRRSTETVFKNALSELQFPFVAYTAEELDLDRRDDCIGILNLDELPRRAFCVRLADLVDGPAGSAELPVANQDAGIKDLTHVSWLSLHPRGGGGASSILSLQCSPTSRSNLGTERAQVRPIGRTGDRHRDSIRDGRELTPQ